MEVASRSTGVVLCTTSDIGHLWAILTSTRARHWVCWEFVVVPDCQVVTVKGQGLPRFQTPTLLSIHQYTVYYSIEYTQCLETPGVSLAADAEKTSRRLASQVTFRNECHAHLTGHHIEFM